MNLRGRSLGWLIAALMATACARGTVREDSERALLIVGGSDLTLQLIPIRDTVPGAGPVHVAHLLYNPGAPREVLYNDRMIEVEVIGPDGETLPRLTDDALIEGFVTPERLALPRNGIIGGVMDLTCASPVNGSAHTMADRGCTWKYIFHEPGSYRLIGHYSTIPDPSVATPRAGVDYLRLVSDTAVIVVLDPS